VLVLSYRAKITPLITPITIQFLFLYFTECRHCLRAKLGIIKYSSPSLGMNTDYKQKVNNPILKHVWLALLCNNLLTKLNENKTKTANILFLNHFKKIRENKKTKHHNYI